MKRLLLIALVMLALVGFSVLAYALEPDTDLSAADASFWGEDAIDYSGCSVASAGDVNGDGYDDILIGAYHDEDGGSDAGQTYLVLSDYAPTSLPIISNVSPQDGDTDVPVEAALTATFSKAMDVSTINADSFTLEGGMVPGTVSYDSDTYTAFFAPDANLEYDHHYTATLSTAITDEAGNPLEEAYSWSFSTELCTSGRIWGRILRDGKPASNEMVVLYDHGSSPYQQIITHTNQNGIYEFCELHEGVYDLNHDAYRQSSPIVEGIGYFQTKPVTIDPFNPVYHYQDIDLSFSILSPPDKEQFYISPSEPVTFAWSSYPLSPPAYMVAFSDSNHRYIGHLESTSETQSICYGSYIDKSGSITPFTPGKYYWHIFITDDTPQPTCDFNDIESTLRQFWITGIEAVLARSIIGAPYLQKQGEPSTKGFTWENGKGYYFFEPYQVKMGYQGKEAGIDCSGLVFWAYNRAYYGDEYTKDSQEDFPVFYEGAEMQYRGNCQIISKNELRPGDLLFFDTPDLGDPDHVAMYVGPFMFDNKEYNSVEATIWGDAIVTVASYDLDTEILTTLQPSTGDTRLLNVKYYGRIKDYDIGMKVVSKSPVDLIVTDPDGIIINKSLREAPGMCYMEYDTNGDGDIDDVIALIEIKMGDYQIMVIAEPGASPLDTYSLEVLTGGITTVLADNVQISNIPTDPYIFEAQPPHNWHFTSSGFFPRHLPDGYTDQVVLSNIDPATIPDEVQGVYWFDCDAMEWKFWAPGAPGCTLTSLGGGHTYDYQVAVTGACNWAIPISGEMTPLPLPSGPHNWNFCSSGFFPQHLPDSYNGQVVLDDVVDVPAEVQGIYYFDFGTWKFWAPGAPGCTLTTLGGGHTYDYMVAVTGDCDWSIPLP